jgi:hypothetical protein
MDPQTPPPRAVWTSTDRKKASACAVVALVAYLAAESEASAATILFQIASDEAVTVGPEFNAFAASMEFFAALSDACMANAAFVMDAAADLAANSGNSVSLAILQCATAKPDVLTATALCARVAVKAAEFKAVAAVATVISAANFEV